MHLCSSKSNPFRGVPDQELFEAILIGKIPILSGFREDEEIVRQVSRHFGGYVRFIG